MPYVSSSTVFERASLYRVLNPFYSGNPGERRGSRPKRLLRALFIVVRNTVLVFGVFLGAKEIAAVLPPYIVLAAGLAAFAVLAIDIRTRDRRGEDVSTPRMAALLILTVFVFAYWRALSDATGLATSFQYVIDIDETLFGAVPTVWLQQHLLAAGGIGLFDVLPVTVYFTYFVVPRLAFIVLWMRDRAMFRVYFTAYIFAIVAGTLFVTAVPTAPPWLAAQTGYLPEVTRVVPAALDQLLGGSYDQGAGAVGINEVAAFPSFHMAETILVVLAAAAYGRRYRVAGSLYAAAMGFSLVYLGEHYVSDLLAGMLFAVFAWRLATKLAAASQPQGSA